MPLTDTLRSRATVRSVARRALGALVAGGLATTLGWAALAAPEAQAAGTVEVTNITTRTLHGNDLTTVQAWQRIDITANWTDKNPTAGDTINLTLEEGNLNLYKILKFQSHFEIYRLCFEYLHLFWNLFLYRTLRK